MENENIKRKRPSFMMMLQGLWNSDTEVEDLNKLLEAVPPKDRAALRQSQEFVTKMGNSLLKETTRKKMTASEVTNREMSNKIREAIKKEKEDKGREPGE